MHFSHTYVFLFILNLILMFVYETYLFFFVFQNYWWNLHVNWLIELLQHWNCLLDYTMHVTMFMNIFYIYVVIGINLDFVCYIFELVKKMHAHTSVFVFCIWNLICRFWFDLKRWINTFGLVYWSNWSKTQFR